MSKKGNRKNMGTITDEKATSRELWNKTMEEIILLCKEKYSKTPLVINSLKRWNKIFDRVGKEMRKSKNKIVRNWMWHSTLSVYFSNEGDLWILQCFDEGVKGHSIERFVRPNMHFISIKDLTKWILLRCIESALDEHYDFYWEKETKEG